MLLPILWIKAVEFHTARASPVEMCIQGWRRLEKVMPKPPLVFVTQKEEQGFIFPPGFSRQGLRGELWLGGTFVP